MPTQFDVKGAIMKILVIGSGGREHAIAWNAAQSQGVEKVFVAPGNAGTAIDEKMENIALQASDIDALIDFAKKETIDLTIVGPEAPLVQGITDTFIRNGLKCFGPTKNAAQLEGSKAFSKDFLARHHIPTARYKHFTQKGLAMDYIRAQGAPLVVKADGLAAGKGVIIARSENEAVSIVEDMLSGESFGEAGRCVVIEEFLQGEEASFIVMADGRNILPLATSQDHKAVYNGDTGPNTGGMGAYSPAPVLSSEINDRVMNEVIQPTIRGMAAEGHPYTGFLYAGLMIEADGTPKVLEFNCRLGDPETQPILLRLKSSLVDLCLAALEKQLDDVQIEWDERPALGVVMAAGGYPGTYSKGDTISGLPEKEQEGVKVFHAGTAFHNGQVVTNGGRVLCVTALGSNVGQAQKIAYNLVNQIKWNNVYYRTDIGYRAVEREQA